MSVDLWNEAIEQHRQGQIEGAVRLYDQALLAEATSNAMALYYAGMAYLGCGRLETAEQCLRRDSLLAPGKADIYFAHASALYELKRHDEALDAFRLAVALEPRNAAMRFNLANAARAEGLHREAANACRAALDIDPTLRPALMNLAADLAELRAGNEAAALLTEIYGLPLWRPDFVEVAKTFLTPSGIDGEFAQCIVAALLSLHERYPADEPREPLLRLYLFCALATEKSDLTLELLRVLVTLIDLPFTPDFSGHARAMEEQYLTITYLTWLIGQKDAGFLPCLLLGNFHAYRGQISEALDMLRRAVTLALTDADAWLRLAEITHQNLGATQAESVLQEGLGHNPRAPGLLGYLGSIMMNQGHFDQAKNLHDAARAHIGPGDGERFKTQLLFSNYRSDLAPQTVTAMHIAWGNAFAARHQLHARPAQPPRQMKSLLKIGYVSCDYKIASPVYFFGPLIFNHDPQRVDVYCYMTTSEHDEATQEFRSRAPHWRMVETVDDAEVARRIEQDGIDILVDLAGHTLEPRFGVFARKPAPIQVSWLGYPNTTGLPTIDYRFTDALADPPGRTEHLHSETLYRLPHFLCYQPPDDTPEIGSARVAANGYVTFGCFNNTNKIVDEVVDAWTEILKRVPSSRLILKAAELKFGATADSFTQKFIDRGIAPERITCFPQFPKKFDHLQTYGEVDMALDPFPYNGTTTTMECLWMGVPMVTCKGRVHAARVGYAILGAMGLDELVAESATDYIDKAIMLSGSPERLKLYRATLRDRLRASPLMDAKAFARSVEDAYFDMWQKAVTTDANQRVTAE